MVGNDKVKWVSSPISYEDVGWFDVSMDVTLLMQMAQSLEDLTDPVL